jgi:hypothetical protein
MKGHFAITLFPSRRNASKTPCASQAGRLLRHLRMEQDNPSVFDLLADIPRMNPELEGNYRDFLRKSHPRLWPVARNPVDERRGTGTVFNKPGVRDICTCSVTP